MSSRITKANGTTTGESRMLRPSDVQKELRLSKAKIYNLIWEGQIESVRVGRAILVPRTAVDAFLERQGTAAKVNAA